MIAYDRTALINLKITQHAEKWRQSNSISEHQLKIIRENHPVDFYTPNFFVRVILFLATVIAVGASLGFIATLIDIDSEFVGSFLCVALAFALMFVLEKIVITEKKYYHAGIDDGFLYMALGFFWAGLLLALAGLVLNLETQTYFLLALPILGWGVIRFADKLLTVGWIFCFFNFLFYQLVSFGALAKAILPFVVMLVSAALYLFSAKLLTSQNNEPWEAPLKIVKLLSLAAFYLGGNYMVVRELSEELLGINILPGEDIPLAPVFYIFTIAIPSLFILAGIRKRDIDFLRIGLLAAAFSIFTFRYYFFDLSYEVSITLAGAALIALALAALKFLKKPVRGVTAKNLLNLSPDSPQFEAFLMADLAGKETEISDKQELFGGGRSGGAGAEGQY